MREIAFNAKPHEIRGILSGRQTQFRRVVKGAPQDWFPMQPQMYSPVVVDRRGDEQPGPEVYGAGNEDGDCWIKCPYGQPGDRLWVPEAWAHDFEHNRTYYRTDADADGTVPYLIDGSGAGVGRARVARWSPSIHMPRRVSRITLEITDVRVERLQDISPLDCEAEGVQRLPLQDDANHPWYTADISAGPDLHSRSTIGAYHKLWNHINGAGSWDRNDWVWVVSFKRVEVRNV